MKSIFVLLATFTLLLTGCALVAAQRQQEAARQAQTIQDECEQKRSSGHSRPAWNQCNVEVSAYARYCFQPAILI